MTLPPLPGELLARPDLSALATGILIGVGDGDTFTVPAPGRVILPATPLPNGGDAAVSLRHALELSLLLGLEPVDAVLAGLAAARCAALFRTTAFPPPTGPAPAWHAPLAAASPPAADLLDSLWAELSGHQPGAPRQVSAATAARLTALWPLLGPAEYQLTADGDTRLKVDAATGLNAYGCSPRPRPWAITFASSTASSVSERGYAAVEQARRRLLSDAWSGGLAAGRAREAARIRGALASHYGLPWGVRVLLVPSGTDGELLALGVSLAAADGRPLTNLLVGPEESGSGVPEAASGRHFSTLTARNVPVTKGARIAGVPDSLTLEPVAIRTPDGAPRPPAEVSAECARRTAEALAQGRRVLFHILDQSKTGLVAPDPVPLLPPDGSVDVLVDASQARLTAASVRRLIDNGAMVLITGSKFFTGPPFEGALLVPPGLTSRLDAGRWPAGFADYFEGLPAADGGPFVEAVSPGLALRWEAALAEMTAFAAAGEAAAGAILERFGTSVAAAIDANPDLRRHPVPLPARDGAGWDRLPTIFAFSVLSPADAGGVRRPFGVDAAKRLYVWLNADLSALLPADAGPDERALAARQVHIGQPVALPDPCGPPAGAFRLSAGARIVSGEPSRLHLDAEPRVAAEIADALAALDKVSLILRHYPRIQAADPAPRF